VLVVAPHDEGGAGQDVGPAAQLNQGSLGLAQACLQVATLAGLDRPFEATQVVGCGGQLGSGTGAKVLAPGPAGDPHVAVEITLVAPRVPHVLPCFSCAKLP
jgi:hypothetical protein